MRRSWMAAAAAGLLCLAPDAAAAAHPAGHPVPTTMRVVVRPVTSTGHAVHGYHVDKIRGAGPIDCSYPSSSVAAVDDDIVRCSPDAAYALACWRAAAPHHVLCLDHARKPQLNRYRTTGKIAHPSAPRRRAPLDMKLANGVSCGLRAGGAGVALREHPDWSASYYCTHRLAVWAPLNAKNFGVHRDGHVWRVELAADTGKKNVHRMRVAKAYFVGTA